MKIILYILMMLISSQMFAIFNDYEPSARARGMSGAVTTFSDDYSAVFYNPAGLRFADSQVGITHYRLFSLDFNSVSAVSGAIETTVGHFGFGWEAMGVEHFEINLISENKFSIGHSIFLRDDVISQTSIGYSLTLHHLAFHELGSQTALGLNLGIIATLHTRTRMGVSLTNVNRPKVGTDDKHDIPQQLAVGMSYIPYEGVITAIDLKKNFEGVTELRTGIEIELHETTKLRMGVRNQPVSFSAGLGFNIFGIHLDYGLSSHAILPLTHHVGLGYKF